MVVRGLVRPSDQLTNTLITAFVACALRKSAKFAQVYFVN